MSPLSGDPDRLHPDELRFELRLAVFEQHGDDLLEVPLELVVGLSLTVRARPTGNRADVEPGVRIAFDDDVEAVHGGRLAAAGSGGNARRLHHGPLCSPASRESIVSVFEAPRRSRLLSAGLLALGVTPAALLVAALVHVGFCHADPHGHGSAEPLCCAMLEVSAHGHHHSGAEVEHAHPAVLQRGAVAVVVAAAILPASPVSSVALPDGRFPEPAHPSRDPPPTPLFLSTHALLL